MYKELKISFYCLFYYHSIIKSTMKSEDTKYLKLSRDQKKKVTVKWNKK